MTQLPDDFYLHYQKLVALAIEATKEATTENEKFLCESVKNLIEVIQLLVERMEHS